MREIIAYLPPNKYSRPGRHAEMEVRMLLIHWNGVPKQRAWGTWQFFADKVFTGKTDDDCASAQGVIDQEGPIIRTMPHLPDVVEMAYHAVDNYPNYNPEAIKILGILINAHTIGYEWCCNDSSGKPTEETWASAVEVYAQDCVAYGLDPMTRIETHNWVTGKGTWGIPAREGPCHKYFVEHPEELDRFRGEVSKYVELQGGGM